MAGELSQAAQDIIAERRRQVEVEGWTPEHDDWHTRGQLASAAACYASIAAADDRVRRTYPPGATFTAWPWERSWWKPKDRRADLIRAGALIIVDIERLDRAAAEGRAALSSEEPR